MQIRNLNPGQTNVNVFIFPSDYAGEDLEIFSPYLNRLSLKSKPFDFVCIGNLIVGLYDNEMLVPAELPFELFSDMNTLIVCSKNCIELELLALADLGDNFIFSVSQEQLERLQKFGEYIC